MRADGGGPGGGLGGGLGRRSCGAGHQSTCPRRERVAAAGVRSRLAVRFCRVGGASDDGADIALPRAAPLRVASAPLRLGALVGVAALLLVGCRCCDVDFGAAGFVELGLQPRLLASVSPAVPSPRATYEGASLRHSLSIARTQARRSVPRAAKAGSGGDDDSVDEFEAARERIRRIQLGIGEDEALPPEEGSAAAAAKALELVEGDGDASPVVANVTNDTSTTDAEEAIDAFAGRAEDVPELKAEKPDAKDGKKSKNLFVELYADVGRVSWPAGKDVLGTFGIVLLLVFLYTGFVAVVDYGSQFTLGQVFDEFYKAAKPEEAGL